MKETTFDETKEVRDIGLKYYVDGDHSVLGKIGIVFYRKPHDRLKANILASHKREIESLKSQCKYSQAVHDIFCEAEFMMKHPECRKAVSND